MFESLPPDPDLFESMRAVGYSLETAVADLIDNSIAAKANQIKVGFSLTPKPHVFISDNGSGMNKDELRVAMKLAGKPPTLRRELTDLGRFGLGLKTASLSQARRLIVLSKRKEQDFVGAIWDLDQVAERGDWSLEWLTAAKISEYLLQVASQDLGSGTIVIWEELDHLIGSAEISPNVLSERMASTRDHLGLVFHRYLNGLPADSVKIFLNDEKVAAIDPFFTRNPATQVKKQKISVNETVIDVTAYVLPNLNRMSSEELATSKKMNSRFRDTQGFYIYRQKRLLMFGTWFRLTPRSELSKLSRIQVDTPNTLDAQWKLGVTKSQVEPPEVLKRALANLVPSIVKESQKVLGKSFKVKSSDVANVDTFWNFDAVSADTFNLVLNPDNAILSALTAKLTQEQTSALNSYLAALQKNFPIKELYSRMVGDEAPAKFAENSVELVDEARNLFLVLLTGNSDVEACFSTLLQLAPYGLDPLLREHLVANKDQITGKGE